MSEQQLLSEKLAIELEKVKNDCPEFSYDLIGQTPKSSKKNAYKLMLNGKKIGEVWPRGNYGHLYTNILTEEEKSKVKNRDKLIFNFQILATVVSPHFNKWE